MYLSKCWRDARLSVTIYAVPMLLAAIVLLRVSLRMAHWATVLAMGATLFIGVASFLIPLVAWTMGGEGIGRDLSDGTGAYLLTRPRSRRFFCWFDHAFALSLMAAMATATCLLYVLAYIPQSLTGGGGHRFLVGHGAWLLVPVSSVIFGGLVYGVTYLCTMLIPQHATARVVSVLVLLTYAILRSRSRHWSGIWHSVFPSWNLVPSIYSGRSAADPHLWVGFAARVLAIGVLLVTAQLVLERREIRA